MLLSAIAVILYLMKNFKAINFSCKIGKLMCVQLQTDISLLFLGFCKDSGVILVISGRLSGTGCLM